MKMQKHSYAFNLPFQCYLSPPQGHGVVIVLHGFQHNAASMMKRIGWLDQQLPFQVLAVNAPFPVPVWDKEGMRETYSWYFRDRDRGISIVEPEQTALRFAEFLDDLDLESTPKILFGFSQGGYLAPYIAAQAKHVVGIVGTGCGYNFEAYEKISPIPVLAIHGTKDERVDFQRSKKEHAAIIKLGFKGEFVEDSNLEHKVQPSIEPLVRNFALKHLKGKSI